MKRLIKFILWPASVIFYIVVFVRNFLFDKQILKSVSPKVPSIGIGNITVGGTGKTPMVMWLIEELQAVFKICMISRGYGRHSKGLLEVDINVSAQMAGDEPLLVKTTFPKTRVIVSESRTKVLDLINSERSQPDILIFDDVFQHRHVKPALLVLLCDFNRPIQNDSILPMGRLREPISAIKRARIIIITKCPSDLSENEALKIKHSLKTNSSQKVLFATQEYGKPMPVGSINTKNTPLNFYAFSGIASPAVFETAAKQKLNITGTSRYKDHSEYSLNDLSSLVFKAKQTHAEALLTTTKDAIKIKSILNHSSLDCWTLPVKPLFLFDGEAIFLSAVREILL